MIKTKYTILLPSGNEPFLWCTATKATMSLTLSNSWSDGKADISPNIFLTYILCIFI